MCQPESYWLLKQRVLLFQWLAHLNNKKNACKQISSLYQHCVGSLHSCPEKNIRIDCKRGCTIWIMYILPYLISKVNHFTTRKAYKTVSNCINCRRSVDTTRFTLALNRGAVGPKANLRIVRVETRAREKNIQ